MREIISLNTKWTFSKEATSVPEVMPERWYWVNLPHTWNARKDPYLYSAEVALVEDDKELDKVATRFGCRSYQIDPNRGFILNCEEYPLRGVSRH